MPVKAGSGNIFKRFISDDRWKHVSMDVTTVAFSRKVWLSGSSSLP